VLRDAAFAAIADVLGQSFDSFLRDCVRLSACFIALLSTMYCTVDIFCCQLNVAELIYVIICGFAVHFAINCTIYSISLLSCAFFIFYYV
jgi:hypothetical protein